MSSPRSYAYLISCLVVVGLCLPAGAQYLTPNDTTRQVGRVYKASPGQRMQVSRLTADTAAVTGQTRLTDVQDIRMMADSSAITWKDTTIASSVGRIVAVNLHDPAQVWSYDAFRAAEKNTSLNRVDRTRVPDVADLASSTAGDTLRWLDVASGSATAVRNYLKAANYALGNVAINGLSYMDGTIWAGQAGTLTRLDELLDKGTQWTTSGQYDFKGTLNSASRNAATGYLLMSASPAIVNNTVNAVAAIRSPWRLDGHRDQLGRQIQYWAAGTAGGTSASSYSVSGSLSIYASNPLSATVHIAMNEAGLAFNTMQYTGDGWYSVVRNMFAIAGPSWLSHGSWANNQNGVQKLRWPIATVIRCAAILAGSSASGNNSSRVFAVADSGLYVLDLKANDETNGSKQEINNRYVSPVMVGNVMVAWSSASTASLGGIAAIFSTASSAITRASDVASPLGAKWTFNGTSSMARAVDNDSLTFVAGQPFSISCWVNVTSAASQTIATKYSPATGSETREWWFGTDSGSDLTLQIWDETNNAAIGRQNTNDLPTGWHHVVGTYGGGTTDASVKLYLDGVQVDNATAAVSTGFASMVNTACPMRVGADVGTGGALGAFYAGSLTPPTITRTVMTPQQIQDAYQRGLHMIQSPWADTLFTAPVVRVKVQPYTGDVMLVHAGSVEIRDRFGAVVDTFMCSSCGTLSDGDFYRIAGVDSLGGGIVFGGTTGRRRIIPDPRLWDAAQARYNYTPYEIPTPALVDSAGQGNFWTLNDALAAVSNVGKSLIRVMRGTYPAATISQAGMTVSGAGDSTTVFDGLIAGPGLKVTGADVTVENIGARTTPGGGASVDSTNDAWYITGARFKGNFIRAVGADDDCFSLAGTSMSLFGARAGRCDDKGFETTNAVDDGIFHVRTKDQAGTSFNIASGANQNVVSGRLDGAYGDAGTGTVIANVDTVSY